MNLFSLKQREFICLFLENSALYQSVLAQYTKKRMNPNLRTRVGSLVGASRYEREELAWF